MPCGSICFIVHRQYTHIRIILIIFLQCVSTNVFIIPFDTHITLFGATEPLFVDPSPYDDPLVFGLSTLPSS